MNRDIPQNPDYVFNAESAELFEHKRAEVEKILQNWDIRPDVATISELVKTHGLTKEDILKIAELSGYEKPEMDLTLLELGNMTPYLHQVIDNLKKNYEGKLKLFFGRDSEVMYDAYVLKYGKSDDVKLFPGSMALWEDEKMETGEMPKRFLADYGLTKELFQDDKVEVLAIDTGFNGTAGYFLRKTITRQYGEAYEETKHKIPIKLISSIYTKSHGTPLMEFDYPPSAYNTDMFPKVSKVVGEPLQTDESERYGYDRFAYRFAMSMQLLPRFHEAYNSLTERDGHVIAVPNQKLESRANVDEITTTDEGEGRNASVVNPIAALIVQQQLVEKFLSKINF